MLNTSPVDRRQCGISKTASGLSLTSSFSLRCSFPSFAPSHLSEFSIWGHLAQNDKWLYRTAVVTVPKDALEWRVWFRRQLTSSLSSLQGKVGDNKSQQKFISPSFGDCSLTADLLTVQRSSRMSKHISGFVHNCLTLYVIMSLREIFSLFETFINPKL